MSKGGSTTSKTEIPAWLEGAAIENINKARGVSELGYVPYYGPDVAAFSPMQQQSMQSTGNAASAFGLAPQGFDAMAGMPQAQSFAGGIQGYSSAPLYEESLAQLQQKRPAQYKAMTDMFIDPFTGARPKGNYGATPTQVEQMFSNSGGGGGGISPTGSGGNRSGNNDGKYFGVNSQYNPYGYSTPTENISGEKDRVADYRDMSFGEGGRRDIGFGENAGNFLKNLTGISTIERGIDYGQGLADGFTPSPFDNGLLSQTSGPSMTPEESMRIVNENADRYARLSNDRGFNPISLGSVGGGMSDEMLRNDTYSSPASKQSLLDNISFGGSNPIPPEQQIIINQQFQDLLDRQAFEDNQAAQIAPVTPYQAPVIKPLPPVVIKKKKKKIVSNSGSKDREPDNWSPPKNNGYSGQSGKKSTKGKARTGFSFGL